MISINDTLKQKQVYINFNPQIKMLQDIIYGIKTTRKRIFHFQLTLMLPLHALMLPNFDSQQFNGRYLIFNFKSGRKKLFLFANMSLSIVRIL